MPRKPRMYLAGVPCHVVQRGNNRADWAASWRLHEVLIEQFIASLRRPLKGLNLDFDATDDGVYGQQEARLLHGYCNQHRCTSYAANSRRQLPLCLLDDLRLIKTTPSATRKMPNVLSNDALSPIRGYKTAPT